MINKLTGPFTGLISKIPGMAQQKPVEIKTKKTAFSCLSCCIPRGKKPVVVTAPKRSMVTLAKNALNKTVATSKQFAVAHKKALIGATALGLAGAAGYAFRDTLINMFSSQQTETQTALSTNSYTLLSAVAYGTAIGAAILATTHLSLSLLSKKMFPGHYKQN